MPKNRSLPEISAAIDGIDRKILRALYVDGRVSFRDLGQRVYLSPIATAESVRRLRSSGYHSRVSRIAGSSVMGNLAFAGRYYIESTRRVFHRLVSYQVAKSKRVCRTGVA